MKTKTTLKAKPSAEKSLIFLALALSAVIREIISKYCYSTKNALKKKNN